jgi:catechol 2,3-dioxygenase-like lactoylglutathione lyase family enzyme
MSWGDAGTKLVAFVASSDLDRSRAFYVDVLGLTERESGPYALVVDGLGSALRITLVPEKAEAGYTVLGWDVTDIQSVVADLAARGITFQRHEGFEQDAAGIWTAPSGTLVAWFSDPDGNTLSVEQHPGS